jgi:hypothetical protein
MSRLSLFVAFVALSCRGARPESPPALTPDASPPLWPRTDGGPEVPLCIYTRQLTFAIRPADVLLLFDRSESMITEFGAGTRYSVVSTLLGQLVDVYQDKLRFGFQPFPDSEPCATGQRGCCAGPPTVPLALSAAPAIRDAISQAAPPGGSTPTAGALRRARDYFAALDDGLGAPRDRYVLLSTDGRPSCDINGRLAEDVLDPVDGTRVLGPCRDALDQVDGLVKAGIKVIVLGVGSRLQDEPGGLPGCLQELARRGQGADARPQDRPWFYSGADPDRLESALKTIFAGTVHLPCVVVLGEEPADPEQVAVFVDGHQVPRNRNYGWDYDSPDDRRSLHFFGEYCRRIDRFQIGAIEVRYGCPPCPGELTCD